MRKAIIAGFGGLSAVAVFLMMQLTTPSSVGPLGVLVFFVLFYVFCASLVYFFMDGIIRLGVKLLPASGFRMRLSMVPHVKIYYYAGAIALAPVILLGMQSIGRVGVVDFALLVLFELLICFYISRRF